MKILIRADGSNFRGMGHISKQITLYKKLVADGHDVLFVSSYNNDSLKILDFNNINYIHFNGDKYFNLDEIILSDKPKIIILDILDTTQKYIKNLRKNDVKIITFDNTDDSAFMCDAIFNIMYYHSDNLKEKYIHYPYLYEGYKYIIMDNIYNTSQKNINNIVNNILLTQGGADTTEKTPFLLQILIKINKKTNINVVIGPAFSKKNIQKTEDIAKKYDNVYLHYNPNGLFELINNSDLVITAGGTTMWEIAALKIPMYIYINEEFEDETANLIKGLGFAIYDGFEPSENDILISLKKIISNYEIREQLHNKMKSYDISNGINRVTEIIKSF